MTELFIFSDQQVDPAHPDACMATVNVAELHKALQLRASGEAPATLCFNLSDRITLECQTAALEWFEDGSIAWRGIVPGFSAISAHLGVKFTATGVRLFGLLQTLSGDWHIRPHNMPARVWIAPASRDRLCCGDPAVHQQQPAETSQPEYYVAQDDGSPAVIDILVLYAPSLLNVLTHDEVIAQLREAEGVTNTIFTNSDINARVRIIGVQSADLHGSSVRELLDGIIVRSLGLDLRFTYQPGPDWDLVSNLRDTAGADIVVTVSGSATETLAGTLQGIAASIPEPVMADHSDLPVAVFSVLIAPSIASYNFSYAFAHELGHLLGGKHDRTTQPGRLTQDPTLDYAHGYVTADRAYVTIMGYERPAEGSRRIPYFSNPDKTWQGQPLGIALGKPGASDMAHLFRLSTRIVARYRGDNAPRWIPAYLNLTVEPNLGGFVTPDQLGPYSQGSQISVRATPRTGYLMDHWLLDGIAMTEPMLSVLMDKDHTLKAVFIRGDVAQPNVRLGPLALRYGCQLQFLPAPGPSFPAGTEVIITFNASSAAMQSDLAFVLLIEGADGISTVPLGQTFSQVLLLERDIILDLLPVNLSFIVRGQRSLSLNTTSQLAIQATYGTLTTGFWYPPGEPVQVEVAAAPEGTTLLASETETDSYGFIHVTVVTGNEEGELALKVRLKDAPERSAMLVVAAVSAHPETQHEPVTVTIIGNSTQQILEGATPLPVKIFVSHLGTPLAATLDVAIKTPTYGISVIDPQPTAGANGVATVLFAPHTGKDIGLVSVSVTDTVSGVSAEAQIAVLPREQYIFPLSGTTVEIQPEQGRYRPFELGFALLSSESAARGFTTLPPGIKMTFSLESGTTGIALATTEAMYLNTPVYVSLTAPVAAGTARLSVDSEYAEPIVITIHASE